MTKKFFSDKNFENSKSMFDSNGKIIKNLVKWENYFSKNKK